MKPQRRLTRQTTISLILALAATTSLAIILVQAERPAGPRPGALASSTARTPIMATVPPATRAATGIVAPTPSATHVRPATTTPVPTPEDWITVTFVATLMTARSAAGQTADFLGTQLAQVTLVVPTGILDGGWDVFRYPNEDVIIQNLWAGETASVWAGSKHSDPSQGLVLVMAEGPVFTYLSPVKAGSLRIVAEHNLRLTLRSANGTTFYFDVLGRRFVDSLNQVVPTATPFAWPTGTPTPVPPTAAPVPTCTPGPTPGHANGEADCLATR